MVAPATLSPFALLALLTAPAFAQVPTWTPVGLAPPSARYGHAMVVEFAQGFVLFGGHDGTQRLQDTWRFQFNSNSWQPVGTAVAPAPRRWTAMAADTAYNRIVLFGGDNDTATGAGDTWVFQNNVWSLIATTGPAPRSNHAMAFDPQRQVVVLFGGTHGGNETWELVGNTWSQRILPVAPPPRTYAAMAWHPQRARVLLFGGAGAGFAPLSDTWELGPAGWTPLTTAMPALFGATMAYDASRERMVLFGGRNTANSNRTFELVDTAWIERFPVNPPVGRYGTASAYATGRGVHLFGGATFGSQLADLQMFHVANGAAYVWSGDGCSQPTLAASGESRPWVDGVFRRHVLGIVPNAPVFLASGVRSSLTPLGPIGFTNCTQRVDPAFVSFGLGNALNACAFYLPVPNSAALSGITFFDQALVVSPGANPGGAVLTNSMMGTTSTK